jgi:hypothetical protein
MRRCYRTAPGLADQCRRPSLVEGTPAAACAAFPGFECVSGTRVALAYLRCLFSGMSGQVIRI